MKPGDLDTPLLVVVGSGGAGKTTLAAALGVDWAQQGFDTLVMTFDPSLRLKDALGIGPRPDAEEVAVPLDAPGALHASLLDARRNFDRLVREYAPDPAAQERILGNRFYRNLAGSLAGILEYMAVEKLFAVVQERRYRRIILDTPPTSQALDFLEAPQRLMAFLDSGASRLAGRRWFDERGRLITRPLPGPLGRKLERLLDRVVGLDLLRETAEFFQAFTPLYAGFRQRAQEVQALLRSPRCRFVLVSGPAPERTPDTMFFARRLVAAGHQLAAVVVNRVHPAPPRDGGDGDLMAWLGRRDQRGVDLLRTLLGEKLPLFDVPLRPDEPSNLASLKELGEYLRPAVPA